MGFASTYIFSPFFLPHIFPETMAVEPVQSAACADPDESKGIFTNCIDGIVGHAVVGGEMTEEEIAYLSPGHSCNGHQQNKQKAPGKVHISGKK